MNLSGKAIFGNAIECSIKHYESVLRQSIENKELVATEEEIQKMSELNKEVAEDAIKKLNDCNSCDEAVTWFVDFLNTAISGMRKILGTERMKPFEAVVNSPELSKESLKAYMSTFDWAN